MKPIIVILAALQILQVSGQSLTQVLDDAIDQLNEESAINNLVAVTKSEQTKVILTNQGLNVTLKLNVQETNCAKETVGLFSDCALKSIDPITDTCTCMIKYENCVLNKVEITGCPGLLSPVGDVQQPLADSASNSNSTSGVASAGSSS
ncbi:uncharacterized protein LOC144486577 [Mustelus asterias]